MIGKLVEKLSTSAVGAKNTATIATRMMAYLAETSIQSRLEKDPLAFRTYLVDKVSRGSRPAMRAIGYDIQAVGRKRTADER